MHIFFVLESPVVVVLSGSMEPAFQRGDILFLNNQHNPIRVGEIVVFKIKDRGENANAIPPPYFISSFLPSMYHVIFLLILILLALYIQTFPSYTEWQRFTRKKMGRWKSSPKETIIGSMIGDCTHLVSYHDLPHDRILPCGLLFVAVISTVEPPPLITY